MRDKRLNSNLPREKSSAEAQSALMRQCARAERSSGDAMRLMARWGVPKDERDGVLSKLIEMKFIDDSRFAAAYMRDKINLRGWGVRKIAAQLRLKGVAREIIEELTSEVDRDSMVETLEKKLRRKLPTIKYKTKYDLKTKLIRHGASLGYDYDVVMDVATKLVQIDEDDETIF